MSRSYPQGNIVFSAVVRGIKGNIGVNGLSAFIIAEFIFALTSRKTKESEIFLIPVGLVNAQKKTKVDAIFVTKDKLKIQSSKSLTHFGPRFHFFQCSCFHGV